jgi:hypothetical protein
MTEPQLVSTDVKGRRRKLALIPLVIALVGALAVGPAFAAPKAGSSELLTVPITGTFTDAVGGVGTFVGTFSVQKFTTSGGALQAVGTLTGTLTNSLGQVLGTVTRSVTLPVGIAAATCEILDLTLGPLDLDLLGLVVHLDQVHLNITAEAGPGNLLGNLLCGVAGLLDGGLSLNIVRDLLNVIVDVINQLGL